MSLAPSAASASGNELQRQSTDSFTSATVANDPFRLLADNLPTFCWIANAEASIATGAPFEMTLPLLGADPGQPDEDSGDADAATKPAEALPTTGNRTVLVVDDEPTVRMLAVDVLEELGYTAIEAADGHAGLKVLRSEVPLDLLITDVGLPGGMDGRQVADAGREARPDLPVLFITGYAENAAIGHGHLRPGVQVLTKPFAIDALAARIRAIVEGR